MRRNDRNITVALPCKAGTWLEQSLLSLLRQEYVSPVIHLLLDGADETAHAVAAKYSLHPKLRIFDFPHSRGVGSMLNISLRQCDTTYWARMDADDISMPFRLRSQLRFLQAHQTLDLIGSGYTVLGTTEKFRPARGHYGIMARLLANTAIAHPTWFAKTASLHGNDLYYREDYPKAEDYELLCRAAYAGLQFANIPRSLLQYRRHGEQESAAKEDTLKQIQPIQLKMGSLLMPELAHSSKELTDMYIKLVNSSLSADDLKSEALVRLVSSMLESSLRNARFRSFELAIYLRYLLRLREGGTPWQFEKQVFDRYLPLKMRMQQWVESKLLHHSL